MKPILAVLAVVAVGFVAVSECNVAGVRAAYHAWANARMVEDLGTFPGAEELGRETHPYSSADSGFVYIRPDGWVTRVQYAVPVGTTARDVRAYFEARAGRAWRSGELEVAGVAADRGAARIETRPTSSSLFVMCRSGEHVTFELAGIEQSRSFWIAVDHRRAGPGCRPGAD